MDEIKYIKDVKINSFRQFKDLEISCGRYITIIAGRNATGKSTILGMIAHSAELKKNEGQPIEQSQFRSEFSELFNASKNNDVHKKGVTEYEISMSDDNGNIIDYSSFRITWQGKDRDRFRLIPKRREDGVVTESKFKHPSLYLGLSRLYPIAETSTNLNDFKINRVKLDNEEITEFNSLYNRVFPTSSDLKGVEKVGSSKSKLTNIGISTSEYDAYANSAGQNNIGKIILALLSYRRQSKNANYSGGILCIDELDATLHPAAQERLFDVLISYARCYKIQVFFTTHSLYLLDIVQQKVFYNQDNKFNNIELMYLTSANGRLKIIERPDKRVIYNEITEGRANYNIYKVDILTEDAEAKWFVEKIINQMRIGDRVRIANLKLGCDQYKDLYKHDSKYFKDAIIILDGDTTIDNDKNDIKYFPFMKLPGTMNPELTLDSFLRELPNKAWDQISACTYYSLTKETFENNCWETKEGAKNREKQKQWFNELKHLFDQIGLFEMWAKENEEEINLFKEQFKEKYNIIAKRNNISML